MALTALVKDELSRLQITKPCCRKAEVSAILRFAPVSCANFASTAACTFSYTRGTDGKSVGRTRGSSSAARSGSGRNAIV